MSPSRLPVRALLLPVLVALCGLAAWPSAPGGGGSARPAGALQAQEPGRADDSLAPGGWNSPYVLELVERARVARRETVTDSTLQSYQADARGFVYFYLDRPRADERTLVRADQIALEVYWQAPDRTKQRIVGLRDEEVLPTTINYHLDHLTIVQDDFDDRIRLGDGDEVEDVVHPVAPGAEQQYDYRLVDSLTIDFPGAPEPVRVYEVQVRPEAFDEPAFVGTIFLDRSSGAIVRMNFSFTPAAYVDPYLDYIRISLDNALWLGRHWLPYRQAVELRRELPQLDFLAGTVIRGRFDIGDYVFNESLPDGLFATGAVSALPEAQRRAFPFEDELFSQLEEEGLATPPSLEAVEAEVREIAREQYLSGLGRLRLHLPSASDTWRWNRAEGHVLGAGLSLRPTEDLVLRPWLGWSSGRERAIASVLLEPGASERWQLAGWHGLPRDIGPIAPIATALNTLSGLLIDRDFLDPWFSVGGGVSLSTGPAAATSATAGIEGPRLLGLPAVFAADVIVHDVRSAERLAGGGDLRPVRPVAEGVEGVVGLGLTLGAGDRPVDGAGGRVDLLGARWLGRVYAEAPPAAPPAVADDEAYLRATAALAWSRATAWRETDLTLRLDGGAAIEAPPHRLFLLGGRGTLLGHEFRRYVGDRFWLARAEAARQVAAPWLGVRAGAAAGRAWLVDRPLPDGWSGVGDAPTLGSVRAGLSLFWDVLHLDVGRGIGPGGDWGWSLAVAPRFHDWL